MWSDLRAAVPQGSSALQSLASSLPDVALASRAPTTSSKYFSSYNRWKSWAREHGLTVFPASPFHFAIYLRHLMTEAKTASPLESAVHSIAWFHQLGGEPSPSDHPLVKRSTLAGAQRLLAHQTTKKEPITLSKTKCGCKPRSKGLSYSRLRELVLEAINDIVPDISSIVAGPLLPQMLAYQIDFLSVMAVGLVNRLRTDMSKILYLLVCRFYLVGLARRTVFMGYSWPGVFLLGASGRTG
ncbi:unnamed protein product, partial [Porites lobata]